MFFVKFEELCKKAKKTTTGVALELGVSKSTVAYWRANHSVIPKQEVLIKIAKYFNVSVDYLLGETKNPSIDSDKGVSEYTVVAMNGTPGAHKITVNDETMNKMAELLEEVNDLPPEKIDMLIKIAKSIK